MKINYGYFRHRLDASSDPKLQRLVDDMGIVALGYYFSLLELFGSNYSKRDDTNRVEIHQRVVANTWRKRVDSCDKVLTKLQLSDLLVYTKYKNTYLIDIPNYSKYFGSYKKTELEKTPNKRKEKKRKEKESKVKEIKVNSVDDDLKISPEIIKILELVKDDLQQTWIRNYPLEFLQAELKKAETWVIANPAKRPKLWGRFLTNWFNRSYENYRKQIPTMKLNKADQNIENLKQVARKNPYE